MARIQNDFHKILTQDRCRLLGLIVIFTSIALLVGSMLGVLLQRFTEETTQEELTESCSCNFFLIESIPDNLTYPSGAPRFPSIFSAWLQLIYVAERTIDIGSFYWTLRGRDVVPDPSAWKGEVIFSELLEAGTKRNITIRIAQNKPSSSQPDDDTAILSEKGAAQVRSVDFDRLLGGGVLHTKLWIVDGKHFFVGSANMDWRSLTQVKELGCVVHNCSCLAKDLQKIFDVYWMMGSSSAKVPKKWPNYLATTINKDNPLDVRLNTTVSSVYFSSSPPSFCPHGRTTDIDSILTVISEARKFVYVSVMDYFPMMLYTKHAEYWPLIDDALRRAAVERGISVKLLASHWNHTRPTMLSFLSSLGALNSSQYEVETRVFVVPAFTPEQISIPFGRVNHNKYMVTDNAAYIGTSNWSGDYFTNTAGVGFIINQSQNGTVTSQPVREQLQAVFERDWNSEYAHPVGTFCM